MYKTIEDEKHFSTEGAFTVNFSKKSIFLIKLRYPLTVLKLAHPIVWIYSLGLKNRPATRFQVITIGKTAINDPFDIFYIWKK